jgi:DNA repair exonuclease SbcCD ATPase subunit
MNKIKILSISGYRGIKDRMTLPLDKKSILLYGDNGSGKSSITDAIEWFYFDEVSHLKSEETGATKGKGSMRNIFIGDTVDSLINIEFDDSKLSSEKRINSKLKIETSNSSDEFKGYIENTKTENLILRYKDLGKFIIATKKEKLDTLQEVVGFGKVGELRDLLKKNATRIAKQIKNEQYDNKKGVQQSLIIDNIMQNIASDNQFFDEANKLVEPLKTGITISNFSHINDVLKNIESAEDSKIHELINFLSRINENMLTIESGIEELNSEIHAYHNSYSELRKEKEKIEKLQILSLLIEGRSVLEREIIKDDFCPLCQQDKNISELLNSIRNRIEDLEEIKTEKEKIEQHAQDILRKIKTNINNLTGLLSDKLIKSDEYKELLEKVSDILKSFETYHRELSKDLLSDDEINLEFVNLDRNQIKLIAEYSKNTMTILTESQKNNQKLIIHTKLSLATQAYKQYKKLAREEDILKKYQASFEALFADFIKRQEYALNAFLEIFSSQINEFYTAMNPHEKVESIKLVQLKDSNDDLAGITIEYNFFDTKKSPPTAYLSESHLNCLGLSFYLASVKAFNKQNGFFILDDVISSFDRSHRTRFAKLLTEKFNDYQIIVLTHEKEFYDIISSSVKSKGWLLNDLTWNMEEGTILKKSTVDYLVQIEDKFKSKDTNGLGNLIRIYLERQLKNIASEIEAKVAFRFNEVNEKRMSSELLDVIQTKISKASSELKNAANIPKLQTIPMLISNLTSHDNTFQESYEDMQVVWEDIKAFLHNFYCSDCERFISIKNYDTVEKKIRCKCGKLIYEWKM